MARRNHPLESLERTVTVVEKMFIEANARDLAAKPEVDGGAREVAQLIAKHIRSPAKAKSASRRASGEALETKIAYLRRLLSSRTHFSPQLRAVFGSSKSLKPEEIEAAIAELVRLGSQKHKKSNDSD